MDYATKLRFIDFLEQFITDNRKDLIERVLLNRTRYLTVVLEDLFQSHNASAVIRTCDCFGIQDVHVIENRNKLQVHRDIVMGSVQWLNLIRYRETNHNTVCALQSLKDQGYRIVATSPHAHEHALNDFDVSKGKAALIFGTERTGISSEVKQMADEFVKIPLYGFTESYNVSVSVAIILHELVGKMHQSNVNWHLSEEEWTDIKVKWCKNSVRKVKLLENKFLSDHPAETPKR